MVGKNTQLATSYFSKEDYKKLKSIAKKEGRSISEVIRNAVIKLYGLDLKKKEANYVKKD